MGCGKSDEACTQVYCPLVMFGDSHVAMCAYVPIRLTVVP